MARRRSARPASRPRKRVKTPKQGADNSRGALMGPAEVAEVRRLIRLVQRTGIGELEVSSGGRTVRISPFGAAHAAPAMSPGAAAAAPATGDVLTARPERASPPSPAAA